jgi:glucose/arabinose dehydrogenase
MLRLDVDAAPDAGLAYHVPADNPFVGVAGRDEIWAYGFRNPYRFSFDDAPGGDDALIVGDVGQGLFEEVDVVQRGGNYGWALREGTACFDPFNPLAPPASCPTTGLLGDPLRAPVLQYDHDEGLAIVGGYVYRGSALPALVGSYVFGDFSRDFGATGRLFYAATTGAEAWVRKEFVLAPVPGPLNLVVRGIGRDEDGELCLLAGPSLSPLAASGVVLRLSAP